MPQPNELNRSLLALDQERTLVAVAEMSQTSWLIAGMVPGIERHPLKKLEPNQEALLRLIERWRNEAVSCACCACL
jgi:transposase